MTGVRVRDRASKEETVLSAPLIVSDIGPRATNALLSGHRVTQAEVLKHDDGTLMKHSQIVVE